MGITIISAMTEDRVIGKHNDLPWHLPAEFSHFKETTTDGVCIMGRRTFESFGKRPLPNRVNIIVSSSLEKGEGYEVVSSVEEGIARGKVLGKEVFICGGSRIYAEGIALADRMILTTVKQKYEGDTYFPEFDSSQWHSDKVEDRGDFVITWYSRN
jgi:dihydrofolate reductase|tara:strand:+ start:459 stop:926 length:468 start_codon:yes stop_codon:yes gene_type:complete